MALLTAAAHGPHVEPHHGLIVLLQLIERPVIWRAARHPKGQHGGADAPVAQGALAEGQAQEGRHQVGLAADPGREPALTGQEVGVAESLGVVLVRALGWAVM